MNDNVIARHLRDLAANTGQRGNHATTLMDVDEAQALNDSEGFEYPVSGDATTVWLWEDAMPHRNGRMRA